MVKYGYTKKVDYSFEEAIDEVTFSLGEQGFGVLSTINVADKIKEKIGKEIDDYIILGACNPSLAYRGLSLEQELGLFLPCNVIVYKMDNDVYVSCVLPTVAMSMIENEGLKEVAIEVEEKLKKAIDNV